MKDYAGSVAFCGTGERVAITSPKGGVMAVFDRSGQFIDMPTRTDISGVGADATGFLTTDGLGGVMQLTADTLRPLASFNRAWDNHLISV